MLNKNIINIILFIITILILIILFTPCIIEKYKNQINMSNNNKSNNNKLNQNMSNNNNKISLIIPCIPRDIKYLNRLIQSINSQTYPPYEIIIALSGINDFYKNKIEYELNKISKYPIFIKNTKKLHYASANRNRGALYANGDLLSFMDADDTLHTQKLEITNYFFKKYNIKFLLHNYHGHQRSGHFQKNKKKIKNFLNSKFDIHFGDKIYDNALRNNYRMNKGLVYSRTINPKFFRWGISNRWGIAGNYNHGHITIPKYVIKNIKYREGINYKTGEDAVFIRDILAKYGRKKYTGLYIDLPLTNYVPSALQTNKIINKDVY